ncbi:MAG: aminomethyl-transferring glycine dehydrogenase subunit GcvPA [Clostridiales bacterium]|jgi:glycine dehydrogenase subunit 1|nr:aminomethyl-transferring glycine dehydrogenase subunit GcvPA [Clostridiales bacterium]
MRYTPHTQADIDAMLSKLGISDISELFGGIELPKDSPKRGLDISGLSAQETERSLKRLAAKNKVYDTVFLGAGAYKHYIPPVVRHIAANPRFVTAYTPYQPEMSQGILQAIFEYQSCITRLTGLDASNASMYDGATAAAEAVLMCAGGGGDVLVSEGVNPDVIAVIETYLSGVGRTVTKIPLGADGLTDIEFVKARLSTAACCLISQPNYLGNIEKAKTLGGLLNGAGVGYIMHVYPMALGVLASPSECGADFATGEGQPLGMPLGFGGPYLGFIAAREKYIRKMTGRIVGATTDKDGKIVYVLTLQAREQHIRREKASSSICSNEALCALTAAVYLSAIGKRGLAEVGEACLSKAHYLADGLQKAGLKLKYKDTEFFNEFVTVSDPADAELSADRILRRLRRRGILGGLRLSKTELLWCATELNTKDEIDGACRVISGRGGRG